MRERRTQSILDGYDQQLVRQQDLVHRFRLLSPAIVMQEAVSDLAGTSGERRRQFVRQLESHREALRAYFFPTIFSRHRFQASDLAGIPRFRLVEEAAPAFTGRVLVDVGCLLLAATSLLASVLPRLNPARLTI